MWEYVTTPWNIWKWPPGIGSTASGIHLNKYEFDDYLFVNIWKSEFKRIWFEFLQVLVDDAAKLHALYPTNAENIKQEQTAVIESWNDLQTRAAQKKEELQAACDFHRFSSAVSKIPYFKNDY